MAGILEGSVKVPGTGGKVPKWAAIAGLAAVGYLIWRSRTKSAAGTASSAAASSGADAYPPDGTTGNPSDPYSTDPATGQTYGDENLASGGSSGLAAGQAGDAFPWDGTYNNPSDPYSLDGSTGVTYGNETGITGGGGGGGGTQGGPPFSTNAQWSQYVLNYFTTNNYGSISGRTDAIGRYLDGLEVNQQQETWINDAIAIGGRPPVAGPNNFPPSIRVTGTKTGGKTYADNPPKDLKAGTVDRTTAELRWTASPHATFYTVKVRTGRSTINSPDTSADSIRLAGLKPGTEYTATVLANPARPSARPASITFKTKASSGTGTGTGTAEVTVPDVLGLSYQRASYVLGEMGLRARRGNPQVPVVARQVPAPKKPVARGSTVTLYGPSTG